MKCEKCKKEIEKNTSKVSIRNRYNNKVIYTSETATTIKECVEEAVASGADLSEAVLWKANLREAKLSKANLSKADLSEADLWKANLSEAVLWKANLSKANLREADLWKADLLFCKMNKKVFKQIIEGWFEWEIEEE